MSSSPACRSGSRRAPGESAARERATTWRGAEAGPASPARSSKPGVHPLEAQSEHGSDAEEDDVSLPFELLVLEVALNTVTKIMEKQLDNFEESTFSILDQFRKFPERSENLEKLGALKNRQSRLEFRLEAHTEIVWRRRRRICRPGRPPRQRPSPGAGVAHGDHTNVMCDADARFRRRRPVPPDRHARWFAWA